MIVPKGMGQFPIGMTMARVARFSAYVLDTGLAALFGLLLMLMAARGGDLAGFGSFALAMSIAGLETSLAVLGIGALLYGRASSRPLTADRLYWPGILICLVSGATVYVLTVAALYAVAAPPLALLYSMAGLRVIGAFGEPLRAIYQARSRPEGYVPLRVLTLTAAMTTGGLAFVFDGGLIWYAAVWGLEWLVFSGALLFLSAARGICPAMARPRVRVILGKASPLFVQSICIAIYLRFDQLYVGWRFGDEGLGVYAAAARLAEAGNMVYGLIALVVGPRIIRECLAGRLSALSRAVLVAIGVGSLCASGLAVVWGGALLRHTFGAAFGGGGMILAVYVLSTCFTVYGTIGSRLNVAQGETLPGMISGLVGAISNVGLTIVLCEVQGPLGAATATVVSYGLSCWLIWRSAWRRAGRVLSG